VLKTEFSQALHESVLDGLEKVLGESGMKVVLLNIELDRCTINPEALHMSLYDLFKDGVFVLEKVIVKELFRKLGIPYEERIDLDFVGCVNHAKELFLVRQERAAEDQMVNREPSKDHTIQPHLKVVRTLWQNSPVQTSFVVVDLNNGQEYPQNFVCVFPRNLFRRNQKGNLKRSKFFRVFGEKTHEVARKLLGDALKRETSLEVRRQIEASLRDINEAYQQQVQRVSFPH